MALAAARLLVPVVAVFTEAAGGEPAGEGPAGQPPGGGQEHHGAFPGRGAPPRAARLRREKTSEMALPMLVGRDGRRAVLAFTCRESLARWRPDARPVAVPAAQVWQAGAEEASAVVVDVAGPVPLTVEGARLRALAAGQAPPFPHDDPDLLAAARAAVAAEPLIADAALEAGQHGGDLGLRMILAAGCDPGGAAAREAVQRVASHLYLAAGGRLHRGVEVTIAGANG